MYEHSCPCAEEPQARLACFCKKKKPNKNFLKLKCDWWCSYFDTTDGYLRFIPTDGQTTVPFFSGRNLIKEGTRQKT
jgi:hypothetical protein